MAPRGGGGRGGGGRGGSGGGIKCPEYAFEASQTKAIIAFAAIFVVVYLVWGCLIPTRQKRAALGLDRPGKKRLVWMFLRIIIFLQVLYAFLPDTFSLLFAP